MKAEVIRLILEVPDSSAELRAELEPLKLKALKIRAAEAGVDAEAIADADDAEDIKSEIIRLIVEESQASALLTPLTKGEAGVIDHLRNGRVL